MKLSMYTYRYCVYMFNSTPVSLPNACRHSRKCSTCYSGVDSSGCVAEVVLVGQSSQAL